MTNLKLITIIVYASAFFTLMADLFIWRPESPYCDRGITKKQTPDFYTNLHTFQKANHRQ